MKPVVCALSIGRLSEVIRSAMNQMKAEVSFLVYDSLLNECTKRLPEELDIVDVFVSSGYNAETLKKLVDRPVITIEPSVYDILLALSKAKNMDDNPIIIPFGNDYVKPLSEIENILSVNIIQRGYVEIEELNRIIMEEKEKGRRCVIGSGLACELAEKQGMDSVFLYPQESIQAFLQIAVDLALSLNSEILKRKRLETIIERTQRGIVFVNQDGIISICNPEAERYFGALEEQLAGKNILDFLDDIGLEGILNIREEKTNIFAKIRDTRYVISAIPIFSKGMLENILFFIENVASIQKTDRQIRRAEMTQRGFVAKHSFSVYNTKSKKFENMLQTARQYALSDEAIVILGETGSGKEMLAQSIHNYSSRRNNAFVAVNCATINENLLESELFGYAEGAFTGAKKGGKEGYFEMAHRGTIFLDEIGEISPALQTKLLRVIQEKELLRVGGTKMIPFDARILTATNRDLWEMVQNRQFREDLYYRLNVLELEIPPLREHCEDIVPLFLMFFSRQNTALARCIESDSMHLESILKAYSWPGNIREMENFVKGISILASARNMGAVDILDFIRESLEKRIMRQEKQATACAAAPYRENSINTDSGRSAEIAGGAGNLKGKSLEYEYMQIQAALKETDGKYTAAAKYLGISRSTLWRKLKEFEN